MPEYDAGLLGVGVPEVPQWYGCLGEGGEAGQSGVPGQLRDLAEVTAELLSEVHLVLVDAAGLIEDVLQEDAGRVLLDSCRVGFGLDVIRGDDLGIRCIFILPSW